MSYREDATLQERIELLQKKKQQLEKTLWETSFCGTVEAMFRNQNLWPSEHLPKILVFLALFMMFTLGFVGGAFS